MLPMAVFERPLAILADGHSWEDGGFIPAQDAGEVKDFMGGGIVDRDDLLCEGFSVDLGLGEFLWLEIVGLGSAQCFFSRYLARCGSAVAGDEIRWVEG